MTTGPRSGTFANAICLLIVGGCTTSMTGERDGSVGDAAHDTQFDASPDASPPMDAVVSLDASPSMDISFDRSEVDVPSIDAAVDVVVEEDAGPMANPAEARMTFMTANVGRGTERQSRTSVRELTAFLLNNSFDGPQFIGWQEIGEGDACGQCEWDEITSRNGPRWDHWRPRPELKVPVSAFRETATRASARHASNGVAGISPTRFVTVVYYAERNLAVLNTHFIAGAWSCRHANRRMRRPYWRDAWNTLREVVANQIEAGHNVVVTGDLNRPRATGECNPAWEPAGDLHGRARIVGGAGIDYIFAVPARGWRWEFARNGDGDIRRWEEADAAVESWQASECTKPRLGQSASA